MLELFGLDGTVIYIKPSSVTRFKYADYRFPQEGTKVDYNGGTIYTKECAEHLYERVREIVRIAPFTLRLGIPIWINVSQITEIRSSISINGEGTELLIGGNYQHVIDPIEHVRQIFL